MKKNLQAARKSLQKIEKFGKYPLSQSTFSKHVLIIKAEKGFSRLLPLFLNKKIFDFQGFLWVFSPALKMCLKIKDKYQKFSDFRGFAVYIGFETIET